MLVQEELHCKDSLVIQDLQDMHNMHRLLLQERVVCTPMRSSLANILIFFLVTS